MVIEARPEIFPLFRLRSPFTTKAPEPAKEPLLRSRFPVTVSVRPAPTVRVRLPETIKLLTVTSPEVIEESVDEMVMPAFAGGMEPLPQFAVVCQSVLVEPVHTVSRQ